METMGNALGTFCVMYIEQVACKINLLLFDDALTMLESDSLH
jgi:hypothetical protein